MASKGAMARILGNDGSPYQQLAIAVIYRAAEDARAGDPLARAWLSSSAAAWWFDALDLSPQFRAKLGALGASGGVYQLVLPGIATS